MAHVGVFCPPVSGHLNSHCTLGRALQARGHRVSFFQVAAVRDKIQAEGLECVVLGGPDTGTDELNGALVKLGSLDGLSALRFTIDCARRLVHVVCRTAPDLVRKAGIDLLLVDQNEPAGATVAEHLGIPFLSICSGLPLNRDRLAPPPFVDWQYSRAPWAKWRNRAAYLVFDRLVSPVNRALNGYRRSWSLSPIARPDDTFSPLAQLCTLVPELDFPREAPIRNFFFTGPMLDSRRPAVPFPYHLLNGKRLIYASFGTLQNRDASGFHHIAEAAAQLDAQLVISLGGGLNDLPLLPGSPIVVNYAPQMELLARSSLCITHGGLNTVLETLSFGVPMIVIPVTNDQPANAARVQWSGAGKYAPLAKVKQKQFAHILWEVLESESYRGRAQALARAIEDAGGLKTAVEIVERHLAPL